MQHTDAVATLMSYRYSPASAADILADAARAGAVVRLGVRVTFDDRHGYRVARADRTDANRARRTRRGAARARARR